MAWLLACIRSCPLPGPAGRARLVQDVIAGEPIDGRPFRREVAPGTRVEYAATLAVLTLIQEELSEDPPPFEGSKVIHLEERLSIDIDGEQKEHVRVLRPIPGIEYPGDETDAIEHQTRTFDHRPLDDRANPDRDRASLPQEAPDDGIAM